MCENHNHAAPTQVAEPETTHEHGHDHGHGHDHAPAAGHHHAPAADSAAAGDDVAECPVMRGSYVAKADAEAQGLVRDYEGTRYYLCCAACGPLFDADPAKYAAAL